MSAIIEFKKQRILLRFLCRRLFSLFRFVLGTNRVEKGIYSSLTAAARLTTGNKLRTLKARVFSLRTVPLLPTLDG